MSNRIDQQILRSLVPVCNLTNDNFNDLFKNTVIETLPEGNTLFKEGQADKKTVYILSGEIELRDKSGAREVITGGTKKALHPLAPKQPRQSTAVARTEVNFIAIDSDLLDVLLTWDQTTSYVVSDITDDAGEDDDSDWMTRILQSNVFLQIPPANIQKMFICMEQVPFRAGETVMRQGDKGDYYYIIQKGECEVSRSAPDGRQIKLAVLGAGDGFGEEALISDTVRNATITMSTDGSLMRLGKKDFDELLRQPVLSQLDYDEARQAVEGGAVWLDVRLENEYETSNIEGSINVPLYLLRIRSSKLDPGKQYIVYCDTGGRSSAASYLLSERGFDVAILKGGMASVSQVA
jgi:CRP-like cAMP-binding protein